MKTKVRFKVIKDRKLVTRSILVEHPDFEVIRATRFHEFVFPPTSIEDQVMSYLDSLDKTQMMLDNGWDMIIDYSVCPVRSKPKSIDRKVSEFYKFISPIFQHHPNLKRPIEAILSEHKDHLFKGNKSFRKIFSDIMNIYSMINKASVGLMNQLINLIKRNETTNLIDQK